MKGISVIICCYNSAGRIKPTLQHLFAQQVKDIAWEIVLVDNNCQDQTIQVVQNEALISNKSHLIRIVNEPEPGLSFAREKGIKESKYDLIIFCDDDNWLFPDYLQQSAIVMEEMPQVSILGGIIIPEFEIPEPEWFKDYAGGYAVGNQGVSKDIPFLLKSWVYGAGMVIRKSVFSIMALKGIVTHLTGRSGNKLTAGDDSEMCFIVQLLGFQVAASNKLKMKHYISKNRLELQYAHRLYNGFGNSLPILNMYGVALQKGPKGYFKFLTNHFGHYLKVLGISRFLFYSIVKPNHPYLIMPHVIMHKNALQQLVMGLTRNYKIYKGIILQNQDV